MLTDFIFHPDHGKRAFSLVELLVVLAIVFTLAALAFPVVVRMRENSNATKCASNLRQIGMAATSWSADNDGSIIPCDQGTLPSGSGNVAYWPALLAPYLQAEFEFGNPSKQLPIYACPSSASHFTEEEKKTFFVSYRANQYGSGKDFSHWGINYTYLKTSAIDSSTFPLLVDGAPRVPTNWRGWFSSSQSDKDLIGFYHGGRANRLFVDGHVDSVIKNGWTPMDEGNWKRLGYSGAPPPYQ